MFQCERLVFSQPDVLQLPEGCDFEALYCQPSTNFDRSTKLDLTTEPPLLGRCCYGLVYIFVYFARKCGYNNITGGKNNIVIIPTDIK